MQTINTIRGTIFIDAGCHIPEKIVFVRPLEEENIAPLTVHSTMIAASVAARFSPARFRRKHSATVSSPPTVPYTDIGGICPGRLPRPKAVDPNKELILSLEHMVACY